MLHSWTSTLSTSQMLFLFGVALGVELRPSLLNILIVSKLGTASFCTAPQLCQLAILTAKGRSRVPFFSGTDWVSFLLLITRKYLRPLPCSAPSLFFQEGHQISSVNANCTVGVHRWGKVWDLCQFWANICYCSPFEAPP